MRKTIRWMYNNVKKNDLYSRKISLTYKGKNQMSTLIGGMISMVIKIIIFTFFISHLITVFRYGETRTATKQILKNYINDQTQFKLMQGNFDIGVAYVSLKNGSVDENLLRDPTYFNVTFSHAIHRRVDNIEEEKSYDFIPLDYCGDRFIKHEVSKLNKIDKYL